MQHHKVRSRYGEGYVVSWVDQALGQPLFGENIYYELEPALEAAGKVERIHHGIAKVVCSEHRATQYPSGSCHYCAMLQLEGKQ